MKKLSINLIATMLVTLFLPSLWEGSGLVAQNIAITDDDTYTANASAMLDVKSTTKGMLIPRLTTAQRTAIVTPATSLLVFDTTLGGFYYYNGTVWINLSSGSSSGLLWSYSSPYVYLTGSSDKVGIGTSTPLHKLHVSDNVTITDGTDGSYIDIQNANATSGILSGIRFLNGTSTSRFKAGIFYKDALSFGRGDLIFANNSVAANGNVSTSDARLTIKNTGGIEVKATSAASANASLFHVLNATGDTIFAVYDGGVRVNVYDDPLVKASGSKGGFAVGGFSPAKGTITNEYMRITPDSIRMYIEEGSATKATGSKGGFAVGGFSPAKAVPDDYFNIYGATATTIINPSEARIFWYPLKEAFLAGRVLVESPDSVGINSFSTGYESKAIGDYSQAFGFHSRAFGDYSTAIGNYANAVSNNSFAFGDSAQAKGLGSYAFGSIGRNASGVSTGNPTLATGNYSVAMGMGSTASGTSAFALGTNVVASGNYSTSLGFENTSSSISSVSLGRYNIASGSYSLATGYNTTASGNYSCAIGASAQATGTYSFAVGYNADAGNQGSIALGSYADAPGQDGVAVGYSSYASTDGIALGRNTNATVWSFAGGLAANASGLASVALGNGATASGGYSKAIGDIEASGLYTIAVALNDQSATNIAQDNTMAIMGGKVGVNDSNPTAYLQVNSLTAEEPFRVQIAGSTKLLVNSSGNTGVNRTPTTNDLEVGGNASKATSGNWLANSDRRIKTDIHDISNSFETILKLRPVIFKYTDEWKKRNPSIKNQYYYNFIAQEYQTVFPESVKGSGEYLEGDSKEILQIDTYNAQIVTIKAVQDLIKENKQLKLDVQEIKNENETLKASIEKINSLLEISGKK
ncbi:MAG: hypothetical protein A2046_08790 [Bacteroidetes bacterium GWA2_30_7]|nr:MAG: hypothetical protein A2046_08790 [Bacteroidetes bacterium GWA2_30_7]